ncbi:MAG: hypothetical protein AB8G99_21625, partial [Planctomycetaceae bacterium]
MLRTVIVALLSFQTLAYGQRREPSHDHDHVLHQFRRVQLTDTYFSEGASFGDINNDGVMDVVCGPYWFAG